MVNSLKPRAIAFLHVLLNRFHQEKKDDVLKSLKNDSINEILSKKIESQSLAPLTQTKVFLLSQIHYTWLETAILSFPKQLQPIIVSCLEMSQQQKFKKKWRFEKIPKLTHLGQSFFSYLLWQKTANSHHIAKEHIAESNLKTLIFLSKRDLEKIIDYLGLHDLMISLRKVVDQALLKSILKTLDKEEQFFLKKLMQRKENVSSKPLPLYQWSGKKETLRLLMHKRGIIRLGAALSGESNELIWHITQILDQGRAHLLKAHIKKKSIPKITDKLQKHINEILKEVKKND